MKKVFLSCLLISICLRLHAYDWQSDFIEKYYPVGTKWTEIRIDTLKYKDWFRKEGNEWLPNYEQVNYYVTTGQNLSSFYDDVKYRAIYCQREGHPDSLCQFVTESLGLDGSVCVLTNFPVSYENSEYRLNYRTPDAIYAFDRSWNDGDMPSYTSAPLHYVGKEPRLRYGTIIGTGEKSFGGTRPLEYFTLERTMRANTPNGTVYYPDTICIVNGIGVISWVDGECVFGPYGAYDAYYYQIDSESKRRHYRSMLVHFERDGEVLYDMWPKPAGTNSLTPAPGLSLGRGEVYDLSGRKAPLPASPRGGRSIGAEGLPKGVYIVNGRKVMVK